MHTGSAEYTTFITSELINRKSGGKATRIAVLKNWGGRKWERKKKAAHSNNELVQEEEKEGK